MRVLIVSPDPAERQRAASALHLQDDVEIVEAAGGPDAGVQLRDDTFDVLVVDGDLQPKGGFSWLYELGQQARMHGTTRPPAIIMAARVEDRWLGSWASAEAMVRKPVDGFVVARHVAELAGRTPATA